MGRSSGGVPPLQEKVYQQFRGLNRRSDRLNMDPSFLFDLLNGYIRKDVNSGLGFITQRAGCSKLNTVALSGYGTNTKIRTVFEAQWDGGSKDVIIRAGTGWGKFNGVDTFTTLDVSRTDDVVGQAIMFKNQLIMADGGKLRKCTSAYAVSDLSSDSAMPTDSTVAWVHSDKVWTNSVANPLKAYYCATNNANGNTAWSIAGDAGYLDLSTVLPIGDKIIGFRTMGGTTNMILVIITTQYLVLYLAGADPTAFQLLKYIKTSCLSQQAINYIGADLIYASMNQITSIFNAYQNNDLEVNSISQFIEPYYRTQVAELTDPMSQMCATFDKVLNHWYITLDVPNNNQTFVYSVDVQNFVGRWTYPFNIISMQTRQDGTVLAGTTDYVYILNTGTNDGGVAISWKMAMPALYFDMPNRFKKPIEFEALIQATASLSLSIDYWYGLSSLSTDKITKTVTITTQSSPWDTSLWDTSYWDASGNTLYNTPDLLGRGRSMFLELRHNTLDALISIPWFVIRYNIEGRN